MPSSIGALDKIIENFRGCRVKIGNLSNSSHMHSLVNSLLGDIAPENHSGTEDIVECRRRLCVVHNRRHFTMVEGDFADVMATGEQKRSMSFGRFALGVIARISQVAGHAFTLVFEWNVRTAKKRYFIDFLTLNPPRSFVHNCEHEPEMSHSLMSSQVLLSTS